MKRNSYGPKEKTVHIVWSHYKIGWGGRGEGVRCKKGKVGGHKRQLRQVMIDSLS